jgi:hypothetical protein
MADYLLDTNTVVLLLREQAGMEGLVSAAVRRLTEQNHNLWLAPQVLQEFWVVATRPESANGLGWDVSRTAAEMGKLLLEYPVLDEYPDLFEHWRKLVVEHGVIGKRAHDYRLFAMADPYDVPRLLTFDAASVPAGLGVRAVNPAEVSG